MMHGQSGGPVINKSGEVLGLNKGHFECDMKYARHNSAPSIHLSVRVIKDFLEKYCSETENGWEIRH